MNLSCPKCKGTIELVVKDSSEEVTCPSCNNTIFAEEMLSTNSMQTAASDTPEALIRRDGEAVDHFRINSLLGKGGFGAVYSAFDTRLERHVALKIPRINAMSKWAAESFIREAQAAAQLNDPNIVSVHEIGRFEDRFYIVSELIDGVSLKKWKEQEEPSFVQIAEIISKIARAIHKAHRKHVIHRDLKPQNILVDLEGQPHITDFGLAKREKPDEITLSTSSAVLGTPAYMSPEQASGRAEDADARTDVYSLGVILYELLTGHRPFTGEGDVLIERVIRNNPVPVGKHVPNISRDLEAICLKAMAKDSRKRFPSAAEFADDLDRFASGAATLTRPPGPVKKVGLFVYKHSTRVLLAIAVSALIAVSIYALNLKFNAVNSGSAIDDVDPRKDVVFEIPQGEAQVAVVRLNFDTGKIERDNIRTPIYQNGKYRIRLEPGYYIVEAYIPNYGIQEVMRLVPTPKEELQGKLKTDGWDITDGGEIEWSTIDIHPISSDDERTAIINNEELLFVEGGVFDATVGGIYKVAPRSNPSDPITYRLRRNNEHSQIEDFWIGKREVTYKNFKLAIPSGSVFFEQKFPNYTDQTPATMIPLWSAMQYCERTHTRLLTLDEYLYCATNKGTTKFPHGNDPPAPNAWKITGQDGAETYSNNDGVEHLFSSATEFTQEYDPIIDPITGLVFTNERLRITNSSFYVVGGPRAAVNPIVVGADQDLSRLKDVRLFCEKDWRIGDCSGLGFRVARSVKPRFLNDTTIKPVTQKVSRVIKSKD